MLGAPVVVGLVGLGALLTGGTDTTTPGGMSGLSSALGLHAPAHAAAGAEPGVSGATQGAAGAFDQPSKLDAVTPSTDTNLGQGVVNDAGLGNGLAEVTSGEEARRDQQRSRAMPYHQQIGPLWWSMDPHQAQQAIKQVLRTRT